MVFSIAFDGSHLDFLYSPRGFDCSRFPVFRFHYPLKPSAVPRVFAFAPTVARLIPHEDSLWSCCHGGGGGYFQALSFYHRLIFLGSAGLSLAVDLIQVRVASGRVLNDG